MIHLPVYSPCSDFSQLFLFIKNNFTFFQLLQLTCSYFNKGSFSCKLHSFPFMFNFHTQHCQSGSLLFAFLKKLLCLFSLVTVCFIFCDVFCSLSCHLFCLSFCSISQPATPSYTCSQFHQSQLQLIFSSVLVVLTSPTSWALLVLIPHPIFPVSLCLLVQILYFIGFATTTAFLFSLNTNVTFYFLKPLVSVCIYGSNFHSILAESLKTLIV